MKKTYTKLILLNTLLIVVQLYVGWTTKVSAISADALHNLSDVGVLAFAYFAFLQQSKTKALLLTVTGMAWWNAYTAYSHPLLELHSPQLLYATTFAAIAINAYSTFALHRLPCEHGDHHHHASYLHMLGDTLISIFVLFELMLLSAHLYFPRADFYFALTVAVYLTWSAWHQHERKT